MASANFTKLTEYLARGQINFGTGTFKGLLVTALPSEGNLDAWEDRADVANEVAAGGGYATGGFAVSVVVALDTTNNRTSLTFSCANPTYTGATISAVGCIVYLSTGVAANDLLVAVVDFGGTVSSTGGNYTVTFTTPLYINR